MDNRLEKLELWLNGISAEPIEKISIASADASFRRYFRVHTQGKTQIAMDAPPDREKLLPFIKTATALKQQNIHTPEIYAQNLDDGFLLIEDLGDTSYLQELPQHSDDLYQKAIGTLIQLQCGVQDQPQFQAPNYNENRLVQEMDLFEDWYLRRHLDYKLSAGQCLIWQDVKELLVKTCESQPQVWVHRDYHSRNLMVVEENCPAVIDFQDLVIGPITYDLASIFKDCYIEWSRDRQLAWLRLYFDRAQQKLPLAEIQFSDLVRWYDLTGLQRHMKVLGIFCRLNYRDGKDQYMEDLPLVRKYVVEVLDLYPELKVFKNFFNKLPHGGD